MKKPPHARPVVESLELRWLPSGLVSQPAAEVSALAAKGKKLALNGTLTGTVETYGASNFGQITLAGQLGKFRVTSQWPIETANLTKAGSTIKLRVVALNGKQSGIIDMKVTVVEPGSFLTFVSNRTTKGLKGTSASGTITVSLPAGPPPMTSVPVPITLTFASKGK